jgi:hypothetical protein
MFLKGTGLSALAAVGVLHARDGHAAPGWNGPVPLGAPPIGLSSGIPGAPTTISRHSSVDNIYVLDTNLHLCQLSWANNAWHGWKRFDWLGSLGSYYSHPAAGSMGPDHESVVYHGFNGHIWQIFWTALGGWKGPVDLGEPPSGINGAPTVISRNGTVDNIYIRGWDNHLWYQTWANNKWNGWRRFDWLGPVLNSDPAAGSMGPDHESVVYRGFNGHIWRISWTRQGSWTGPVDLGAPPVGLYPYGQAYGYRAPTTVSRHSTVDNIYVRGSDNALWYRSLANNTWYGWRRFDWLGGVLASDPEAGSMGPNHESVVYRGFNGHVWQIWWLAS